MQFSTFTGIFLRIAVYCKRLIILQNVVFRVQKIEHCRVRVGEPKLMLGRKFSVRTLGIVLTAVLVGHNVLRDDSAYAQDRIGEAVAVVESTTVTGQAGTKSLTNGARLFLGDRLVTDDTGTAQLLFTDGTRMVVGPKSELLLDAFVFRSAAAENQFAVRALTGAFRFITGDSPKDSYLIHTPTATMGVRGTSFDIAVRPDETSVLVYTGSAAVCSNSGGCAIASGAPER